MIHTIYIPDTTEFSNIQIMFEKNTHLIYSHTTLIISCVSCEGLQNIMYVF